MIQASARRTVQLHRLASHDFYDRVRPIEAIGYRVVEGEVCLRRANTHARRTLRELLGLSGAPRGFGINNPRAPLLGIGRWNVFLWGRMSRQTFLIRWMLCVLHPASAPAVVLRWPTRSWCESKHGD
jgi:hypothetical protein